MDQSSLTIPSSSWSNYEQGQHEHEHGQHQQSDTMFSYLRPVDQTAPPNDTPSSNESSPLGTAKDNNNNQENIAYPTHIPPHPNGNLHHPQGPSNGQGVSAQEMHMFNFQEAHINRPNFTSSEGATIAALSQQHFHEEHPQQDHVFLQDLFHHYSMNAGLPASANMEALVMDQVRLQQMQQGAHSNDSSRSPMPNLDSHSTGSIDTNMGIPPSEEFTPLLSPAVTPFDTAHPGIMPSSDFTMPGTYFDGPMSPSIAPGGDPAMRLKDDPKMMRRSRTFSSGPVIPPSINSRQTTTARVAKMSPMLRTTRKSSTKLAPTSAQSSPVATTTARSSTSSMEQGVFLESNPSDNIADLSMPPPQTKKSRAQDAAKSAKPTSASDAAAATPASLMNLPESKDVEMMDSSETEIHLLNAVRATNNIAQQSGKESGRRQKKGKAVSPSVQPPPAKTKRGSTTKAKAMVPPKIAVPLASNPMPPKSKIAIAPAPSPTTAPTSSGWRPRSTNIAPSPNLIPKISPRISPRLEMSGGPDSPILPRRSSGMGDDLSALLASKSNYQNIVEGNHDHLGLSYPEGLSADLTSKRRTHKLAEQERRNRINSALSDLGKVLGPSYQASSKASIVEMAIEYIESLKSELVDVKTRLHQLEQSVGGAGNARLNDSGDSNNDDDKH